MVDLTLRFISAMSGFTDSSSNIFQYFRSLVLQVSLLLWKFINALLRHQIVGLQFIKQKERKKTCMATTFTNL